MKFIVGMFMLATLLFGSDSECVWVDESTGLMWQDAIYTKEETKAYEDDIKYKKNQDWQGAVNYCVNLSYAGYSDWYIPSMLQLITLHKKSKLKLKQLENNNLTACFWSGAVRDSYRAYHVIEHGSSASTAHKSRMYYVRCVRNVQ